MSIFSRLSDIINSNINVMLDRAEDPEKIIRLIIQEMEETLVEVRSSAAKTIADRKDVDRKSRRLAEAQAEWERKAELALSKDREDLAKAALVERAKLSDIAAHLDGEREALDEALARCEGDIGKLDAKLREAKAKKATIQARQKTAVDSLRVRRNIYDSRIEEAFERFDKVEAKLDRIEGEAEAFELGRGKSLSEEIDDLAAEETIQADLDALKQRMKQSATADVPSSDE